LRINGLFQLSERHRKNIGRANRERFDMRKLLVALAIVGTLGITACDNQKEKADTAADKASTDKAAADKAADEAKAAADKAAADKAAAEKAASETPATPAPANETSPTPPTPPPAPSP
jgi:membrane protein involved in colicin uptake